LYYNFWKYKVSFFCLIFVHVAMFFQSWKLFWKQLQDDGKEKLDMSKGDEETVKQSEPRKQISRFKTLSFPVRSVNTK
jgi:Tfp pilus assembly protein PilO